MIRIVAVLSVLSSVVSAQEDPLAWLPLRSGSRRVYDYEWKSGDPRRPNIERWTLEETIAEWVQVPEGIIVLREVTRMDSPPAQRNVRVLGLDGHVRDLQPGDDGGYLVSRERAPYLVRGNCVYVVDDGFDAKSRHLSPTYKKYLAEGTVSADFCFPLEAGRRWGTADLPWRVESGNADLPPALVKHRGAIHIVSDHFGSGGLKDVWFRKGVGVVGEHYVHKGSYDEYTKTLVSFSP